MAEAQVGFQDEALRRMQRKAGVSAVSRSGKGLPTVDEELRSIADSVLNTVGEKKASARNTDGHGYHD